MTRRANGQRAHSGQTGVWSSAERCPKVEEKIEAQHAEIIIYCSKLRMLALATVI